MNRVLFASTLECQTTPIRWQLSVGPGRSDLSERELVELVVEGGLGKKKRELFDSVLLIDLLID